MNTLLFEADAYVGQWVVERIPHLPSVADLGPFRAIGVVNKGEMLAGVIYHNYFPAHASCEVTFAAASPRWASRGVIRALLSVPFEQYGCRRLGAITPHKGEAMECRILPRLGFVREGTARQFFSPTSHAAIFGLLRDEFQRKWGE